MIWQTISIPSPVIYDIAKSGSNYVLTAHELNETLYTNTWGGSILRKMTCVDALSYGLMTESQKNQWLSDGFFDGDTIAVTVLDYSSEEVGYEGLPNDDCHYYSYSINTITFKINDGQTIGSGPYYIGAYSENLDYRTFPYSEDYQYYAYPLPALEKPIQPAPSTGVENLNRLLPEISWKNGGGATKYDVYCNFGGGSMVKIASDVADAGLDGSGNQLRTAYALSDALSHLSYLHQYSWRVDAKTDDWQAGDTDEDGTIVTGDVWTFITAEPSIVDPRPPEYDPDEEWDEETQTWDTDLHTAGGGRYKQHIICLSNKGQVYYGEV